MKVLVVNGPNLNMLGRRDPSQYGSETLAQIQESVRKRAHELGVEVEIFQSNHEGAIIDYLQKAARDAQGIIINAGAFTHYSYAIRDALADTKLPFIEVHLSDVKAREEFRRKSVFEDIATAVISGHRGKGYIMALEHLAQLLSKKG
ncbi:MAG: type II 3-dehydroquinate dehydratase [SAR202 cluster bacterium]|nr:type II 3-dehydroquinate dehydratase [SAR202 cluster bacterium]